MRTEGLTLSHTQILIHTQSQGSGVWEVRAKQDHQSITRIWGSKTSPSGDPQGPLANTKQQPTALFSGSSRNQYSDFSTWAQIIVVCPRQTTENSQELCLNSTTCGACSILNLKCQKERFKNKYHFYQRYGCPICSSPVTSHRLQYIMTSLVRHSQEQKPQMNHIITIFYSYRPPYNPWKAICSVGFVYPSETMIRDVRRSRTYCIDYLIFVPSTPSSITTVLHSMQDDKAWTHIYLLSYWDCLVSVHCVGLCVRVWVGPWG